MTTEIIQSGLRYATIDEAGRVQRLDGMNKANDQWRITGAVRFNNFGHIAERFTLADVLAGRITQWQYKNGVQRVHLTDFDHGHFRMWMSPNHRVVVFHPDFR